MDAEEEEAERDGQGRAGGDCKFGGCRGGAADVEVGGCGEHGVGWTGWWLWYGMEVGSVDLVRSLGGDVVARAGRCHLGRLAVVLFGRLIIR